MKKTLTILSAIIIAIVIYSCEKRKDFLAEAEQNANEAPVLEIKKFGTGASYVQNLTDTSIISSVGYKLSYNINDVNVDKSTFVCACVTNCNNLTSITVHADSNYVVIKGTNNVGAYTFDLTVKDKFGLTSTAHFKLVAQNATPKVLIRKFGSSFPMDTVYKDSVVVNATANVEIGFELYDDNSFYKYMTIVKGNSSDGVLISKDTVNKKATFFFAGRPLGVYKYKFVVKDQNNVVSDTTYFTFTIKNDKPFFRIKNATQATSFVTALNDSARKASSSFYTLKYTYIDDNSTENDIQLVKLTASDPTGVSFSYSNDQIVFDLSSTPNNSIYRYKMYSTDLGGKISDTCYLNLYVFNNKMPVFMSITNGQQSTTQALTGSNADVIIYQNNLSSPCAPYSSTMNNSPYNCYTMPMTLVAYDADANWGGYISKVKYTVSYRTRAYIFQGLSCGWNISGSASKVITKTYVAGQASGTIDLSFKSIPSDVDLWYPSNNTQGQTLINGWIYDNNNDSVSFFLTPTW